MLLSNFKGPGYGHKGLLLLLRAPEFGGLSMRGTGRRYERKRASAGECCAVALDKSIERGTSLVRESQEVAVGPRLKA